MCESEQLRLREVCERLCEKVLYERVVCDKAAKLCAIKLHMREIYCMCKRVCVTNLRELDSLAAWVSLSATSATHD